MTQEAPVGGHLGLAPQTPGDVVARPGVGPLLARGDARQISGRLTAVGRAQPHDLS